VSSARKFVIYLAVLPKYRDACIELVRADLGSDLAIFVSPAHLDETVTTGIRGSSYEPVKMIRLFGNRAFLQVGGGAAAIRADTTLVDLNPRSLTAWLILISRAALRRRTLVWGHLYPQSGAESMTARLRKVMRRLAAGTVTYTLDNLSAAKLDIPGKPAWAAPNALYTTAQLAVQTPLEIPRTDLLYVGRFEPAKKVSLAIEAFAIFGRTEPSARLVLIGGGSQEEELRQLATGLEIADRVVFAGWIDEIDRLRDFYASAFASVSPGFAGLGLTQSLGFGVPMIIANGERHSPEIELAVPGDSEWFASDDPVDFARAIALMWGSRDEVPLKNSMRHISEVYSADSMASGLIAALRGEPAALAAASNS